MLFKYFHNFWKQVYCFLRKSFCAATLALNLLCISGFNLQCDYVTNIWLHKVTGKTCLTKNVEITAPNQTVTSINGETFPIKFVKMILFYQQTVNFVPNGIEKFFPALTAISFSQSKLKAIGKSDIRPFNNLRILYIANNEVEQLSDDLFEFNTELQAFVATNNSLKSIGSNILTPLAKLEYVDLRGNVCINEAAESASQISKISQHFIKNCSISNQLEPKTPTITCQSDVTELKQQNDQLTLRVKSLEAELISYKRELSSH